jgi:hypothetical protein
MDGGVPQLQERIAAHVRERSGQRHLRPLLPATLIAMPYARVAAVSEVKA